MICGFEYLKKEGMNYRQVFVLRSSLKDNLITDNLSTPPPVLVTQHVKNEIF